MCFLNMNDIHNLFQIYTNHGHINANNVPGGTDGNWNLFYQTENIY